MILSQSLIIYKFPTLFNILNEIKGNLNFDIEYLNDYRQSEKFIKENVLIISGEKQNKFQNQINIDEYPINIQKLVEIININFLKNKFNFQNKVKVGKYNVNLNSRVLSNKYYSLALTEKEMKIISFLNNSNKPVTIEKLQSEVWGHKSKLETHTVETHVYRLRRKVEKKFKDNSFILSLKNGYKIEG